MKKIYIHIGFPKCASTFLQWEIFPNLEDYHFEDKYAELKLTDILKPMLFKSESFIDLKSIKKKVLLYLENVKEDKIIISSELFVGNPLYNFLNFDLIIEYLKEIFPEAKVLLIIRKQDDWLESVYSQILKQGASVNQEKFVNFLGNEFKSFIPAEMNNINIDISMLDYSLFIKKIEKTFGKTNLEIVPLELLKINLNSFQGKISNFLECDISIIEKAFLNKNIVQNKKYSLISSRISFFLNKFFFSNSFLEKKIRNNTFYKNKISPYVIKNRNKKKIIYAKQFIRMFNLRFFLENVLDRFLYIKGNLIKKSLKNKIIERLSKKNKILDKEYDLGLKDFNYYN